jgi:hypothetical protein
MKTKTIIIIAVFGCILLAAFIIGITGGLRLHDEKPEQYIGDNFVGILITREPLDLADEETIVPETNQKIIIDGHEASEAERTNGQKRLYAKLSRSSGTDETAPPQEYVFDGVDGIYCFCAHQKGNSGGFWNLQADEGITDVCWGDTISGTIYMVPRKGQDILYVNRVYQTPSGLVYAVRASAGNALQNGVEFSVEIEDEDKGALFDNTAEASGVKVPLNIKAMEKPVEIALLQFGSGNELLGKTVYQPGTLPEYMDSLPDTQYIIVETTSAKGVSRELYQKDNTFVQAFYGRDDGICIRQNCEINWK